MKATGMTRRIDELGRIVVPKELRTTLSIDPKTPLEIFVDGDRIILRKYMSEDMLKDEMLRIVDKLGGKEKVLAVLDSIQNKKTHATT